MGIQEQDKWLVRLYMAACFHKWDLVVDVAKQCYKVGCDVVQIRACIRHVIIFAGYGPCLAATIHLHKAGLIDENTPGKVGGPPGNGFELVYEEVTDVVRKKLHTVDPVLAEYIRLHLYGDIYSSPGLTVQQKQLCMVAFLSEADMRDQLFSHSLAAFRFGAGKEACLKAIAIAFEMSNSPSDTTYKGALKTLDLAYAKFKKDFPDGPAPQPEVTIPDPDSVRVPPLYNVPYQA